MSALLGLPARSPASASSVKPAPAAHGLPLAQRIATSFQFNDSSLTPNTTYYYRLYSVYKGIENPTPGPEVAVTTLTNPPTLLSATALSPLSVSGSWSPIADSAGYVLNAKACFGTISQIKSNANTQCNGYGTPTYTTSWAANVFEGTVNIDPLVRYAAYWVSASAKNSAGYPSLPGNSLVRFLPLSVTLTNVDISGSNQLRTTWTNTTEEYFDVQRRLSSATPPYSWTTVKAALPADTLSWTDTTVTNNTGYCYQIRAYAAAGDPGRFCLQRNMQEGASSSGTPCIDPFNPDYNNRFVPMAQSQLSRSNQFRYLYKKL